MFIAMNRFRVRKGSEDAFEEVWLNRDTHLEKVPGFVEFHLLKGPQTDDYTLYASHSVWRSRDAFKRGPSRIAPRTTAQARTSRSISITAVRGFEVKQTVRTGVAVA
jgi:heme-degrading monooxygenase HmoA